MKRAGLLFVGLVVLLSVQSLAQITPTPSDTPTITATPSITGTPSKFAKFPEKGSGQSDSDNERAFILRSAAQAVESDSGPSGAVVVQEQSTPKPGPFVVLVVLIGLCFIAYHVVRHKSQK